MNSIYHLILLLLILISCHKLDGKNKKKYTSIYEYLFHNTDLINLELTEKVIWDGETCIISQIINKKYPTNDSTFIVTNRILEIITKNQYDFNRQLIDTIHTDGGEPIIEDMFFANADSDLYDELFVIVKRRIQSSEAQGDFFQTYIYKKSGNNKIERLNDGFISQKLNGSCNCTWNMPSDNIIDSKEKVLYILNNEGIVNEL